MAAKHSLVRSMTWIFFFAVVINGLAFGGFRFYKYWKRICNIDYKVPIKAIIQTGPLKEALKTTYLAELLNLSVDQPTLSSNFDLHLGAQKLLASPVIKEAEIRITEPGILHIDYTTRQPIALLADYENIALDAEGYPFPIIPFFSPKKLPQIYLGVEDEIQFNRPITGEKKEIAYEILRLVSGPIVGDLFNIVTIDVSNAFEQSYGRREIVLIGEDLIFSSQKDQEISFTFPRLLRLSTKNFSQNLGNYLKLREKLLEKEKRLIATSQEEKVFPPKIIDFRISQLAFIDE